MKWKDAGSSEEDSIPPAGDYGVSTDPLVPPLHKEGEERLAHVTEGERFGGWRVADETVFLAGSLSAGLLIAERPEPAATLRAFPSFEVIFLEKGDTVVLVGHADSRMDSNLIKMSGQS